MEEQNVPYRAIKPTDISDVQWEAIIEAWENGLSDREASFRASKLSGVFISEARIMEMVRTDSEIGMLKDSLHSELLNEAKLNIAESVRSGNVSTSKWYLERKAPEEFSSKAAFAFEGAVAELSIEEKKEQMDAFMEQFGSSASDNSVLKVGEFPDE